MPKKNSIREEVIKDLCYGTEYNITKVELQNAYLATDAGQGQKGSEIADEMIKQNERQLAGLRSELEFFKTCK